MIKERYVNLEIARLLKEKGFHELCHKAYHYHGYALSYHHKEKDFNGEEYSKLNTEWYSAPSLAVAMAWLRNNHNKHCQIGYDIQLKWYYDIIDLKETTSYDYEEMKCWRSESNFESYEEVADAAILECLTNLI